MADNVTNSGTDSGSGEGSSGEGKGGAGDTGQSGKKTQDDVVSQTVFQQIKKQRDALKGENETLKTRKFVSDEDFAELEQLRIDDASRQIKEMEAKGEFEKLKAQLMESHTTELSVKDKVIMNLRKSLSKEVVDGKILSAATDKAHDPAKIVKLLRGNINLEFNPDGSYATSIVDDNENKVYDDNGDPIGLADFVVKYVKDNPDLQPSRAVSGSGGGNDDAGSGSQAGSAGGKIVGAGDTATRIPSLEEQGRMTPEDITKKIVELKKAGVKGV